MTNRAEVEREIKDELHEGEQAYLKMKAKVEAAGDDVSDDTRQALRAAGEMLDKGKARMKRLADASDDEFDKLWAESKEEWHEIKHNMADGWLKVKHNVKDFFA